MLKLICPNIDIFDKSIIQKYKKYFRCKFYRNLSQSRFNKLSNNYDIVLLRFSHFLKFKKGSKIKYVLSPTTGLNHIDKKITNNTKIKIFNLKNKIFLGNSGVNFLSIFISLLIVKSYNTQNIYLFCDEIFLLLFIPGIDAARVTIYRALKNKSPFSPDRTHLHHYLEKILNDKFIWIAYTSLSILPIIILSITENFFISILTSTILYSLLFNKFFTKKFKSIR